MRVFQMLDNKRIYYSENKNKLSKRLISDIEKDFMLKFANDTVSIDGNSMTYYDSKAILDDGYAVGGKSLREHFELINSWKAFDFVKEYTGEFSETFINDIYKILLKSISDDFTPCKGVGSFIADFSNKKDELHPIELACWAHAEFVKVHPFAMNNGRVARLLMNYILMSFGFLPVSIKPSIVAEYKSSLDDFACSGDLNGLVELVYNLEKKRLNEYIIEIAAAREISDIRSKFGICFSEEYMLGFREGYKEGCKEAFKESFEEGYKMGKAEATLEVAKNLLQIGMDIETICLVTHFTREEVEQLNKE